MRLTSNKDNVLRTRKEMRTGDLNLLAQDETLRRYKYQDGHLSGLNLDA